MVYVGIARKRNLFTTNDRRKSKVTVVKTIKHALQKAVIENLMMQISYISVAMTSTSGFWLEYK